MTALELSIAFILGIFMLIALMWFINAKGKTILLFALNSLCASVTLIACSYFVSDYVKLNAFSLFSSAFLGFFGIVVTLICNIF